MVGKILCTPPDPDMSVIDRLLELSDERDAWLGRIRDAGQQGYEAGYADGRRDGYAHGTRDMQLTWPPIARPLGGPTLAELNLRRWGPGGRKRFGYPDPADRFPRLPGERSVASDTWTRTPGPVAA